MKKYLLLLIFCFLLFNSDAQITLQKIFDTGEYDYLTTIIQLSSGDIVLGGFGSSQKEFGDDGFLSFLDSNGNEKRNLLLRTDEPNLTILINSMIETTDDSLAAIGSRNFYSDSGDAGDIYFAKLDKNGNFGSAKLIGGKSFEIAHSIKQTRDSGYILAGASYTDSLSIYQPYICKLGKNGNLLWSKITETSNNTYILSMIVDNEENIVVAGYTDSIANRGRDVYLAKWDKYGNLLWEKGIGGNEDDYAVSILLDPAGGYTLAGSTKSFGAGLDDVYLIHTDTSGNIIWSKTFGTIGIEAASNVSLTKDNGYIIAANTQDLLSGIQNFYVIKLKADASLDWTSTFGDGNYDFASVIIQANDRSYYFAGSEAPNGYDHYYIARLDSTGNICEKKTTETNIGTGANLVSVHSNTMSYGALSDVVDSVAIPNAHFNTLCSEVFPLTLIFFSAKNDGEVNKLYWTTANEVNVDRFIVERSGDAVNFISIGTVSSKNNPYRNDYNFTDAFPLDGINYYHLRMVDKDGGFSFSDLQSILFSKSTLYQLYPNPAKNALYLKPKNSINSIEIQILSLEGKMLLNKIFATVINSPVPIDISNLNAGNYFLRIKQNNTVAILKFIKQ